MCKIRFVYNVEKMEIPAEFEMFISDVDNTITNYPYCLCMWYDMDRNDSYNKFLDYLEKQDPKNFVIEEYERTIPYCMGELGDNPFRYNATCNTDDELVLILNREATKKFELNEPLTFMRSIVDKHIEDFSGDSLWHWNYIKYSDFYKELTEFLNEELNDSQYVKIRVNNDSNISETDGLFYDEPFHAFSILTIQYVDTQHERNKYSV